MSLPDEREVWGEEIEHGPVAIAKRASFAIQDEVAGAGLADGEEQLHHVVDAEWPADLSVEVEPAELAEAEDVGDATRHTEGSDTTGSAPRPRGKGVLIDDVLVQRPHRREVRPVRAIHHSPIAEGGVPLFGVAIALGMRRRSAASMFLENGTELSDSCAIRRTSSAPR